MTPKEQAITLVNEFFLVGLQQRNEGLSCALIAVNKIIVQWEYIDTYLSDLGGELNPNLEYWYKVKQEIENLDL